MKTSRRFQSGFTLAEVLIALALLGIVAAFTIPKVMQSTNKTHRNAIFKETFATINQAVYEGTLQGTIYSSASLFDYLKTRINAIKTCETDFRTEECYVVTDASSGLPITPAAGDGGGLVLPSGAVIVNIGTLNPSSCATQACGDGLGIDWNGNALPNKRGEDLVYIGINWGGQSGVLGPGGFPAEQTLRQPGQIYCTPNTAGAANYTLWQSIISQ